MLFSLVLTTNAQSSSQMMVAVNGGLVGPACTNCGILAGGGASFSYAVTDRIVPTVDAGLYTSSSEDGFGNKYSNSALLIGIGGDFYFKEAYKGFFIGPEVAFIQLGYKVNGTSTDFSQSNVTIGANLGWAISAGDRIEIIPHFGYSTWFENSKGRVTMGLKLGFKF